MEKRRIQKKLQLQLELIRIQSLNNLSLASIDALIITSII